MTAKEAQSVAELEADKFAEDSRASKIAEEQIGERPQTSKKTFGPLFSVSALSREGRERIDSARDL